MSAWVLEKHRLVADLLLERGLADSDRELLDALLDRHIAMHGSPQRSLAAVELAGSVSAMLASLRQIDDLDVQQALSAVAEPSAQNAQPPPPAAAPSEEEEPAKARMRRRPRLVAGTAC